MLVHVFTRKPNFFIWAAGALSRGCPPQRVWAAEGPAKLEAVTEAGRSSFIGITGRWQPACARSCRDEQPSSSVLQGSLVVPIHPMPEPRSDAQSDHPGARARRGNTPAHR